LHNLLRFSTYLSCEGLSGNRRSKHSGQAKGFGACDAMEYGVYPVYGVIVCSKSVGVSSRSAGVCIWSAGVCSWSVGVCSV